MAEVKRVDLYGTPCYTRAVEGKCSMNLRSRFSMGYLLPILALLVMNLGNGRAIAVFNGVVPGKDHPTFPGVVKIFNANNLMCSGVFIGPYTMLTAAHCLGNYKDGGVQLEGTSHRSEQVFVKPSLSQEYLTKPNLNGEQVKYDLAVVVFPKSAGQSFLDIAEQNALIGAQIIVAGYGTKDPTRTSIKNSAATFHVGYNQIATRIDSNRIYKISANLKRITNDGTNAITLPGDSGGPLIVRNSNKIIGICSGSDVDQTNNTLVAQFVNILSLDSIAVFQQARAVRPDAISDDIVAKLDKILKPNDTDERYQQIAGQPSPTTAGQGQNPAAAPASPVRRTRPVSNDVTLRNPSFFVLDEPFAKMAYESFSVVLPWGLYHTDQEEAGRRPDLRIDLIGEQFVEWKSAGVEFKGRMGFSADQPKEIWLITETNLKYLLQKSDGIPNRFLELPKLFVQTKQGVIYFDHNWMLFEKRFDGKPEHAFDLRVFTHKINNSRGEQPLLIYNRESDQLVVANWPFIPVGSAEELASAPQPEELELSLINLKATTPQDRVLLLKAGVTWPFFIRQNGLYFVKKDKTLHHASIEWEKSRLAEPTFVMELADDFEPAFRNGEFTLLLKNKNGTASPLLVNAQGRIVRQGGRIQRFSAVSDDVDRAMSTVVPNMKDLLEIPRSSPLYSVSRLNQELAKSLGSSQRTWVVLVYEDGQMPEELIGSFVQSLENGTITVPQSLSDLERAWLIPGDKAFASINPGEVAGKVTTVRESLQGKRSLGILNDFPTKRSESVDLHVSTFELFWEEFQECVGQGSCRIITSMPSAVYQGLSAKLPNIMGNATVIEVPKIDGEQRRQVALVLRRQLEQDFSKIIPDEVFDQILKYPEIGTKGIESPRKEEIALRKFLDWVGQRPNPVTEISNTDLGRYLTERRQGAVTNLRQFKSDDLRLYLEKNMVGHRDVIQKICALLKPLENGTHFGSRPIYFVLTGTPGVGKTRIANLIANFLTGDGSNHVIDFKEFTNLDSEKVKQVFQKLRSTPNQLRVVTLDDVDRANYNDLDSLRGIFDNGYFAAGSGNQVPFQNTVVILTANWGEKLILQNSTYEGDFMDKLRRDIVLDESSQSPNADPNPRGKISNRVWRVLNGKIFVMAPFTEFELFQLAQSFVQKRSRELASLHGAKQLRVHPMLLLKHISKEKSATAGASDLENALELNIYPAYEAALNIENVKTILLVPQKNGVRSVTNLESSFSFWEKSLNATESIIQKQGINWFLENAESWFQTESKKWTGEDKK